MNALIPVDPTHTELVEALQNLLAGARARVFERHGDIVEDGAAAEAEITHEMLALSERERRTLHTTQAYVVAYVARQQLWRFHPDGYGSLRQFLQGAGLGKNTVSNLDAIGRRVVPFCDAHSISIDPLLTEECYPKLREAIPALRRAIGDDDPQQVERILKDVGQATNRGAIRKKYRKQRARYGHGTTMNLGDGRVLLVALIDDEDAAKTVIRRLDGALEWDLVLSGRVLGDTLKVVVDDG